MPNLNQILKEEIVRIGKREINKQVGALKGQLVEGRPTGSNVAGLNGSRKSWQERQTKSA